MPNENEGKDYRKKDEPCAVINVYCDGGKKPPHPKPKKHCCKKGSGLREFGEVFSIASQTLAPSLGANQPGGIVLLEQLRYNTSGIDVSQSAINGSIKIMRAGWYNAASGLTGALNPIPAPLPVWTMSLFKNGVIIPGSTFSNVPLSPAQQSNQITADSLVHFNVGDVLTLANTSTDQLFLAAPTLGTTAQTNSAFLKIMLLEEDCYPENQWVRDANKSFLDVFNASTQSFVDATTVNISQLPSDALINQASANDTLAKNNAAQAALTAAMPYSTPASVATAQAALNASIAASNNDIAAANAAVASTDPVTTAASVVASSANASAASALLNAQLESI